MTQKNVVRVVVRFVYVWKPFKIVTKREWEAKTKYHKRPALAENVKNVLRVCVKVFHPVVSACGLKCGKHRKTFG